MFGKSVLKLWPTVVRDQTGGDPSPYGMGVLKGEIFARFLGRDCNRVFTGTDCTVLVPVLRLWSMTGQFVWGDWKIIAIISGGDCRYSTVRTVRRTVSCLFYTALQSWPKAVLAYGLYSVLFSVLVTCTVRHHWRLCCYELRVLPYPFLRKKRIFTWRADV